MIVIYLLYPYLFMLIPILFLYKTNIGEVISKNVMIFILILSIIYIILYSILVNIYPIHFTSIIIFNFFIYLYYCKKIVFNAIIKPIIKIKKVSFFQWLINTCILVFTYFSIFYKIDIKLINIFSITIFIILLFINIIIIANILSVQKKLKLTLDNQNINTDLKSENNDKKHPNIYFILPDSYPGWEILNEYTNFNNINFFNYLKEKKFNIIEKSFSNYRATFLSLPSMLNMQYLDNICESDENGVIDKNNLIKCIKYNSLYEYLISKNYKITELFNDWNWSLGGGNINSPYKEVETIYMNNIDRCGYKFLSVLFEDSIIFKNLFNILESKKVINESLNFVSYFKNKKFTSNNNFIMTHIMLPHLPFIINKKLKFSYSKALKNTSYKNEKVENMIYQTEYTNNIIKDIIDDIISKDKESIIILQSDHGNHMDIFLSKKYDPDVDEFYDKTQYNIIRAIYYKGEKIDIKSPTSINTLREVFNILFEDNLELLDNRIIVNEPYCKSGWINNKFYDIKMEDL